MWRRKIKSSRGTHHSPLPRREVPALPQVAEETPLVASPALSLVETTLFFIQMLFYVLKINTPSPWLSLPLLITVSHPMSHALMPSHTWTLGSALFTLKPFVLILFSIKRRKLLTKALYVFSPSPFHFSPSCSALRLLGKAWQLACPSFSPVVNGKGKKMIKELMRGFLNTIKIHMNLLPDLVFFNVVIVTTKELRWIVLFYYLTI